MFFDEFFDLQKVCPKSQISEMLPARDGTFGRGRRERRGAGEEKEEGSLRTVD